MRIQLIIYLIFTTRVIFSQELSFPIDTPVSYSHFSDILVYEKYIDEVKKIKESYDLDNEGKIIKTYTEGFLKEKQLTELKYENDLLIERISYMKNYPWDYSVTKYHYNLEGLKDTVLHFTYDTITKNIWDREIDSLLKANGKVSYPPVIDTVINGSETIYKYDYQKTKKAFEDKHLIKSYNEPMWSLSHTRINKYLDGKESVEKSIDELGQINSVLFEYNKIGQIETEKHYSKSSFNEKNKNYLLNMIVKYSYFKDSIYVEAISNYNIFKYKLKFKCDKIIKSQIEYLQTEGVYNIVENDDIIPNEDLKLLNTVFKEYKYDSLNRIKEIKHYDNDKIIVEIYYEYNTKFRTQPELNYYEY
jgi:hypothetical protein